LPRCSSPSPSLCSSHCYSVAARRLEPPLSRAVHEAELEHTAAKATFTPRRLVELHHTMPPSPLRSPAPVPMSYRFKPVAAVLVCPASSLSRCFCPRGELTADAPPASSPPPPSFATRTSRGTAEAGNGTGALRSPQNPSSHHGTRQTHEPRRQPPDDPLTAVSPPPRCTAMDRSPGEPSSSPDPSNRAPTPLRCSPTGFPAPPHAASNQNRRPPPPARHGSFSPTSGVAHVTWARPKPCIIPFIYHLDPIVVEFR
jgi:hypothetical protein